MLAMLAAAAMTATVAAAPTADLRRPALTFAPAAETCKTNGRFEIADPALLSQPYKDARASVLGAFESAYLKELFERASGNVSRAAREAQVDRSHLIELLKRHGIRKSD